MESRCLGLRSLETGLIYGRFSVTVGKRKQKQKQKQKQKLIQIQGVFLHTNLMVSRDTWAQSRSWSVAVPIWVAFRSIPA